MTVALSVVMPVYNEAPHLAATVGALADAVSRAGMTAELIVVDDGSSDGSGTVAAEAVPDWLPLRLLSRSHEGRFRARRAGVERARYADVLLLDARVRLHADALRYVAPRLEHAPVWNGHVVVQSDGNPFGAFGDVLVRLAWSRYFSSPRATSFGLDDFDHYPKGTGCFLAPKVLLLAGIDAFAPRTSDLRFVSDDTQLIRWIAARQRIHLAPEFGCDYQPRTNLSAFLANAMYRGATFLDGHGRRDSRFFPLTVAFFPISAACGVVAVRRSIAVPLLAVVTAFVAAAAASRVRPSTFEAASFAALAPVYAVGHGAGMWRALGLLARDRIAAPA